MSSARAYDVVVVGSGITGLATAAAVAERGASVLVVEKEAGPAYEASGRAQGSLRIQGRHAAELPLAEEAIRLWSEAAAEDPASDIELRIEGNLYLCTRPEERETLHRLVEVARAAGLDRVRYLDAGEVRELVPAASGPLLGAMWSPYDAQAQPARATRLFARRARRAGADFAYDTKVTALCVDGDRMTGVETTRGSHAAGAVVAAAGVWSAHLTRSAGLRIPLLPVILSELQTTALAPIFAPSVRAEDFGARQRPDGRVVVSAGLGAVVTRRASLYDLDGIRHWLPRAAAFRKNIRLRIDPAQLRREVTVRRAVGPMLVPDVSPEPPCDRGSVARALTRLGEVFPAARSARVERCWGGLVDMTPDGLPILDRAGPDGLVVLTGMCGHGLALGPVLGRIGADLALDGVSGRPVDAFSAARFERTVPLPEMMI